MLGSVNLADDQASPLPHAGPSQRSRGSTVHEPRRQTDEAHGGNPPERLHGLAKEHLTRLRDKKEQWERYCQENDISDLRFYYEILPKVAAGEEDDPLHWLKRVVQLADLADIYDYIGFLHLVCRRPMAISILAA